MFCLKFGMYCAFYFLFNLDLFWFERVYFPRAERHTQPHEAVGIFESQKKKEKVTKNYKGMLL